MMSSDRPHFITIASGKGGVGKTWLAISLSHALLKTGRRVLLVDADLGLANVDVQLGLTPRVDLGTLLTNRITIASAITRHDPSGLDILAGRSGSGLLADLSTENVERLLEQLRTETGNYDIVLIDLNAGIDRTVRRIASWSNLLLVVATDEPTSLTDAYAVLKIQNRDDPSGDIRILINQAASALAGQQTYMTLRRACMAFLHWEPPLAGVVRLDAKVRDAIRRQTPLLLRHPSTIAAQDVEAVAKNCLTRRLQGTQPSVQPVSLGTLSVPPL
jgi:flagellar biosynthesis protein FlhG